MAYFPASGPTTSVRRLSDHLFSARARISSSRGTVSSVVFMLPPSGTSIGRATAFERFQPVGPLQDGPGVWAVEGEYPVAARAPVPQTRSACAHGGAGTLDAGAQAFGVFREQNRGDRPVRCRAGDLYMHRRQFASQHYAQRTGSARSNLKSFGRHRLIAQGCGLHEAGRADGQAPAARQNTVQCERAIFVHLRLRLRQEEWPVDRREAKPVHFQAAGDPQNRIARCP